MRNNIQQLQPYSGTILRIGASGDVYDTTHTDRYRQSKAVHDVLPVEPPYPARDTRYPHPQTFATWLITDCVGNYTILDGVYPQRTVYSNEPVYPGPWTYGNLLGYSQEMDDLEALCTNQLLSALRNSNLMLGASLGEGRQSASMIAKAVRSTLSWKRSASSVLSVLAEPLRKGSKRAANAWLEYTYGWVPLMSDVWGSANFHSSWLLERNIKARRSSSSSVVSEDGGPGFWKRNASGTVSRRFEMSRRIRVTNPQLFDLQRLGLLNPLSTAWELLPYSFVADWFIDIGGYLEGLETACGLGYEAVSGGYDTASVAVWSHTNISMGSGGRDAGYLSYHGSGAYRGTWKDRRLNSAIPYPRVPGFKVNLGASRIISAGALVRQLF